MPGAGSPGRDPVQRSAPTGGWAESPGSRLSGSRLPGSRLSGSGSSMTGRGAPPGLSRAGVPTALTWAARMVGTAVAPPDPRRRAPHGVGPPEQDAPRDRHARGDWGTCGRGAARRWCPDRCPPPCSCRTRRPPAERPRAARVSVGARCSSRHGRPCPPASARRGRTPEGTRARGTSVLVRDPTRRRHSPFRAPVPDLAVGARGTGRRRPRAVPDAPVAAPRHTPSRPWRRGSLRLRARGPPSPPERGRGRGRPASRPTGSARLSQAGPSGWDPARGPAHRPRSAAPRRPGYASGAGALSSSKRS